MKIEVQTISPKLNKETLRKIQESVDQMNGHCTISSITNEIKRRGYYVSTITRKKSIYIYLWPEER